MADPSARERKRSMCPFSIIYYLYPNIFSTSSLRIESTYGPTVNAKVSDEVDRIAAKLVNTKIATGDDRARTNHLQMSKMESAIFCEFLHEPLLSSL